MDTPKEFTHVSLCAGYGGIDLGLKRAIPNLRTIAFSEIEAFACANLVAKMEAGRLDPAPIWTNLKTFPWGAFRDRVDILSGGYPCQPFSVTGKRLGTDDPRHLWPFIAAGIRAMQPGLCFFENVEGHISLGLEAVIGELEEIGYRTTWGIFSAAEVGAPHQRKRVFILAHRFQSRLEGLAGYVLNRNQSRRFGADTTGSASEGCFPSCWPSRPSEPQHEWEPSRVVGNTTGGNGQRGTPGEAGHAAQSDQGLGDTQSQQDGGLQFAGISSDVSSTGSVDDAECICGGSSGAGCPQGRSAASPEHASERTGAIDGQAQPPLGGDPDGRPGGLDYAGLCLASDNRTDELRLLGNGVVPAVAHKAFVTLYTELFS